MGLAQGSVDAALCTLGLSAMPGVPGAIENVRSVLRPGGRFVVLDARPFDGAARVFNPLARVVFRRTANWNDAVDTLAALREVFGDIEVQRFNGGSAFIAVARKG
jgi:demethylmenaquinone methyltransferase/2-methoxy-6-polyprenyl-1,4-benzoquinol methylase